MKRISKYFALTCMVMGLCLFLAGPARAQRGAGGGGHSGGGGGGHAGGGFSGGGGRASSGVSGRPAGTSSFNAPRSGYAPRAGVQSRGVVAQRGGVVNGQRAGYNATRVGVNGTRYNVRSYRGGGLYGHGGSVNAYRWNSHHGYFYNGGYYCRNFCCSFSFNERSSRNSTRKRKYF